MAKHLTGRSAIVQATKNTSLASCKDYEPKVVAIISYLTQFAAIDRRELTDEIRDTYVRVICGHKPEFSLRQVEKGLADYLESGERWPWPSALVDRMEEEI